MSSEIPSDPVEIASGGTRPPVIAPDTATSADARHSMFWPLAFLGLLGSLALIPYQVDLLRQLPAPMSSMADPASMATGGAIQFVLFLLPAIALGLRLGPGVQLGRFVPEGLRAGEARAGDLRGLVASSLGLGLLAGGALLGIAAILPDDLMGPLANVEPPPPMHGLLASAGAGITEELFVRLGLMTLFAWTIWKLFGVQPAHPPAAWSANAGAAIAFGALHLPQAALLGGITPAAVLFVMLGNGSVGMLFGWLYWRRGLLAAMLAHFATDIPLHVLAPALDLSSSG